MVQEPPSKTWIVVIVAIISAAGLVCAAIIGLGAPFAEHYADNYFPQTPSSFSNPSEIYVQPQSNAHLVMTEKTGSETRKTYAVTLSSNEVIIGDAYDFQDKGYTCVVFLIKGPGSFQFAVLDGTWYKYSDVEAESKVDELLQGRVQYLQNHWFCKNVAFPIEKLGQ